MPLVSQSELINAALAAKVVSFPTDTVPALAVLPAESELIFQLKQRQATKPLILMAGNLEELWQYVQGTVAEREIWQAMADKYLPGALTLVLPASNKVPSAMNPLNPDSIGIRVPNHPIAIAILQQTGALATTSANLSGQEAITNMGEIAKQFPDIYTLDYQVNNKQNIPSTVIKWVKNDWQILRQGLITGHKF
jgi:L-threonylcarbamoyladenylate synthase